MVQISQNMPIVWQQLRILRAKEKIMSADLCELINAGLVGVLMVLALALAFVRDDERRGGK